MTHSSSTASPTLFQCQSRLGNLVAEFATADCPVRRVVADSRQVMPGDLFVAISGSTVDGCRFIDDAIAKGAAGVLYEGSSRLVSVPAIRVADSYRAWGILAEFANSGGPVGALPMRKRFSALQSGCSEPGGRAPSQARCRKGSCGTNHGPMPTASIMIMTRLPPIVARRLASNLRTVARHGASPIMGESPAHDAQS